MPRIHLLFADGHPRTLEARAGRSLMQAAVDAGVEQIAADCGGCMTCATCHVYIDHAWLDRLAPAGADEQAMLDMTAEPRQPESRLACQITLSDALDGLTVRLPSRQY